MDSNVKRTKELLEAGYKIIRVEMKYESPGSMKHMVTLKKGERQEVVQSADSPEFLQFIVHFKPVKDKYDNAEFIYIEDLQRYDRLVESAHPVVLQDHHRILISGREFSQGITTIDLKPSGPSNRIGTAQIWVDLSKNPDFKNVDFKDEVEVRDRSNTVVLKGYVRNYESTEIIGFLLIQDHTIRMESEKITAEFTNMKATDSVGLLTEFCGFGFKPEGESYGTNTRAFAVIAPVQNLIIDQTFRIGNVQFYQDFNGLDDSLIRKSNTGRTNPLWNGNFPRARTQVRARGFFEGIAKGYDAICRAIDVVSFRTDWSFPSIEVNGRRRDFMYSYYKHLSRVKVSTLVYCREIETQARTIFNVESIVENVLSFELDPQRYFSDANELCEGILKKDILTEEETRVLQVLHWLRKSIQDGNRKDKLLDLWVAFEFLTSGTSVPGLFGTTEIASLLKLVDSLELSAEQKRAVRFRIGQLNEPPQMAIFNHLVRVLGVQFTDAELKILSAARRKRTDIIHGKKDPEIHAEELEKMRTILEKVLIGKISALRA